MRIRPYTVLLLSFFLISNNIASAQAPDWLWARKITDAYSCSITNDIYGNVIVLGSFSDPTLTIGPFTVTNCFPNGEDDIFIAKYDKYGNVLWLKSAGGSSAEIEKDITSDLNGNIIITGYFHSPSIIFGNDTLTLSVVGPGKFYVAKYDSMGNDIWGRSIDIQSDYSVGQGITTDNEDAIISCGYFVDLNNINNMNDIFLVKHDSLGNVLWTKTLGGNADDKCNGITIDGDNNIYITGSFNSTEFDFGSDTLYNTNPGTPDVFIAKFDHSGNSIWAHKISGSNSDEGTDIKCDQNNNIVVSGVFDSPYLNIESVTLTNHSANYYDIFIIKYDSDGGLIWAKSAGGELGDYCGGLDIDSYNNISLGGPFYSNVLYIGDKVLANSTANAKCDLFVAMYNSSGDVEWAVNPSGNDNENLLDISIGNNAEIFIVGTYYSQNLIFGSDTLTSFYSWDVYIASLCNSSGINTENLNDNEVILFPSPASDYLTVILPSNFIHADISIYNILGEFEMTESFNNQKENINVTALPEGIHIIEVSNGSSKFKSMFIKQ